MSVQEMSQKAAMSVTEVASMCLLSRSRFHTLVKVGVFPKPVQAGNGKRPYYTQQLAQQCVEIRRTGIGQDGKVVLFNRPPQRKPERKRPPVAPPPPPANEHADLIEALRGLGLTPSSEAVSTAVKAVFPGGIAGTDQGEVIRKVFLYLQGKRSG